MARCPSCEERIDHVIAEKIDLEGTEEIDGESGDDSQAIATLCPECDAIIGI